MNKLGCLYTDFWAGALTRKLATKSISARLHCVAGRYHPSLGQASVESFNLRALTWGIRTRWSERQSLSAKYDSYVDIGGRFSCAVRNMLCGRRDLGIDSTVFAYDTGALELFEAGRSRGLRCILGQMDPNRVEASLVQEERSRWPGWEPGELRIPEPFFLRREKEWALADVVLVNSIFCRDALLRQGVPQRKLAVIPLCFEMEDHATKRSSFQLASSTLKVLFLGQVILRKGIQYLVEAAKLLSGEDVQFDVVGPISISRDAVASIPSNVTFHGRVSRQEACAWYHKADVFVLPTISDGFAITQLEAMHYGLPVITTPNCGGVVTDGVDGFVVPIRDPEALSRAVAMFLRDRGLLEEQRRAALVKSRYFSLQHLARSLCELSSSPDCGIGAARN